MQQRVLVWAALAAMPGLGGCKSHYVEAVVRNESGGPVSLVEVDYPSASFGKEALAAGAEYHYRFKILGSGPTKVTWTDAVEQEHSVSGPYLQEGQQGSLRIILSPHAAARWAASLQR